MRNARSLAAAGLFFVINSIAQVTNGGFELGLSGWTYNSGVFIIGIAGTQPIGVDGIHSADLGGGEITGAVLSQSVIVAPNSFYNLAFYSAAAGATGLVSVGKAEIQRTNGAVLGSLTFTNVSLGSMLREKGFVSQLVAFSTDATTTNVILRFSDLTPGGGVGVDLAIDGVAVNRLGTCATVAVAPSLANGSFESGLTGWSYNAGVYFVGNAVIQPIGVSGSISADLGGADIAGAQMWQSIAVVDDVRYELTFAAAANGSGTGGLTAVGAVEVENAAGVILAAETFTNISPSVMLGSNGFVNRTVIFEVGSTSGCVTIRFRDITPNGQGVDVAIDAVRLRMVAVAHNLTIDTYPGITINGPETGTYRIDILDQFASPAVWAVLTNVVVTQLPFLYIDRSAPSRQVPSRFYRATLLSE